MQHAGLIYAIMQNPNNRVAMNNPPYAFSEKERLPILSPTIMTPTDHSMMWFKIYNLIPNNDENNLILNFRAFSLTDGIVCPLSSMGLP